MQSDGHTLSCYKENTNCEVHHINAAHLDIQNVSSRLFEKYFSDIEVENLQFIVNCPHF